MKIVDLGETRTSLSSLVEVAENEDVLLTRNGHALARLEKFTDEDWDDWAFEHDPQEIARGQAARERLRKGEGKTLQEVAGELGVELPKEDPSSGKDQDL